MIGTFGAPAPLERLRRKITRGILNELKTSPSIVQTGSLDELPPLAHPHRGKLWVRIVSGDGIRKTRLHNYKGEMVSLAGLWYLPHSLVTAAFRSWLVTRFAVPWIGWRAIKTISRLLRPEMNVLEFGSGMSSVWLARRCRQLVSIEHDATWFSRMSERFRRAGIGNVSYLRRGEGNYVQLDGFPVGHFDFVLVDGIQRDRAVAAALPKVRSGGYLYLDNSDVTWNDYARAEKLLLEAARHGGRYWYFTDFFPGNVAVSQGLLVQLP